MTQLTAADAETHSPDLMADNIAQLQYIFPEAFTHDRVHFDNLRAAPSNWTAFFLPLAPS